LKIKQLIDNQYPTTIMSKEKPRKIFISYRWDCTYHEAKILQRSIEVSFEHVHVFRDEERAAPGDSLTETIKEALNESDLVLALFHEGWQQNPLKHEGSYLNKLFKEDDWIRLELDYAKNQKNLSIIPILCNKATLPPRKDLEELKRVLPECLYFLSDDILAIKIDKSNTSEKKVLEFIEKHLNLTRRQEIEKLPHKNRLKEEGLLLPNELPDKKTVLAPFLGLPYFEEKDACLFLGRSDEICDLWDLLERKASRLILLHGYSGVGKSSLLHAGLFPRIKQKGWTVVQERRQKDKSLHKLLEDLLLQVPNTGKTLLVVDQLEEALIEPFQGKEELPLLFLLLKKALNDHPNLKVIFGFRKEFLPEIQKQVKVEALETQQKGYFLEPLDNESILEAIKLNDELKAHFGFTFEDGLEEKIAASIVERSDQLHSGEASNKAPWLQLLLHNLWSTAQKKQGKFNLLTLTESTFTEVRQKSFPDMVKNQLDKLEQHAEPHLTFHQKGLTLDLLNFLTTAAGTAGVHSDAALIKRYPVPESQLIAHLQLLENLQLVTRIANRNDELYTRLAHDSLAPVIRERHEQSDKPAQKAYRVFQGKIMSVDIVKDNEGIGRNKINYNPIRDSDDHRLLREVRDFMYRWSDEEQAAFDRGAEILAKAEAELHGKTAQIFDGYADVGIDLIASLDHKKALEKMMLAVQWDINFELKKQKLQAPLEELLFFFAEGGINFDLARKSAELLNTLASDETFQAVLKKCVDEGWNDRDKFKPLLKSLPSFEVLMARYYPEMIPIPGDTFTIGSPETEKPRFTAELQHEVALDSFKLASTPVTFYQYALYCEANEKSIASMTPSWGRLGDHPLVNINWYDAAAFCNWLSAHQGLKPCYDIKKERDSDKNNQVPNDYQKWLVELDKKANGFRLPTSAEWEFAARGGTKKQSFKYAGSNDPNEVGWYWENSGDKPLSGTWENSRVLDNNGRTHPVKEKAENGIGLYDMSGNVYEWCWDWYDEAYYAACKEKEPVKKPFGPESSKSGRVLRGGAWYYGDSYCRVACRYWDVPNFRVDAVGFRLAQD